MGGSSSTPTKVEEKEVTYARDSSVHIAELHSRFHMSGLCVISYLMIIAIIAALLYCFRRKLCPQLLDTPRANRSTQNPDADHEWRPTNA